jgi:hypothetical protein
MSYRMPRDEVRVYFPREWERWGVMRWLAERFEISECWLENGAWCASACLEAYPSWRDVRLAAGPID